MKRGLVLCGGGAKGAYEAGCIKALRELGYEFDVITGTSIGALNGLLCVQEDYDALYHLWETLTIEGVLKEPVKFDFSINSLLSQANLIQSFFKSYVNEKGADITPLKEIIWSLYDGNKAKKSKIDYGCVCVRYPSLKPIEMVKSKMTSKNMVDYAMASASCFPAFPMYKIGNYNYIDGGYFDNLPISLAIELGADEVIAIELNQELTHSYYNNRPNIKIIRPSQDLGGFLDFDRDVLDKRMKLGYSDTLKQLGIYKGFKYTFYNDESINGKVLSFYRHILKYENDLNRKYLKKLIGNNESIPLTNYLMQYTNKEILNLDDYYYATLENVLNLYGYDTNKIYHPKVAIKGIVDKFRKDYKNNNQVFMDKLSSIKLNQLTKTIKGLKSEELINLFYYHLDEKNTLDFNDIANSLIEEFLIALFLYNELS